MTHEHVKQSSNRRGTLTPLPYTVYVSEKGQSLVQKLLVMSSPPGRSLNQCCYIVDWTHGTEIEQNLNKDTNKELWTSKSIWNCRMQSGTFLTDQWVHMARHYPAHLCGRWALPQCVKAHSGPTLWYYKLYMRVDYDIERGRHNYFIYLFNLSRKRTDGLVQESRLSFVNVLEILRSCTKSSTHFMRYGSFTWIIECNV